VSSGVGTQLEGVAIKAGLSAVPVVGGLLSGLSGVFTGGHAKAVAREQSTLCEAVPGANAFLRQIDGFVQTGQLDYATAAGALDQGLQNWLAGVKSILKDAGGKCNAACFYEMGFRAAIDARKQNYAAASAQLVRGGNSDYALPSVDPLHSVEVPADPISVAQTFVGPRTPGVTPTVSPYARVSAGPVGSVPSVLQLAGLGGSSQVSLSTAILVGGALLVAVIFFGRK
jgi:hypothetical protein